MGREIDFRIVCANSNWHDLPPLAPWTCPALQQADILAAPFAIRASEEQLWRIPDH
jgi:hypothetical protein